VSGKQAGLEDHLLPDEILLWKGAPDLSRSLPWDIRKGQIITMIIAAWALIVGLYELAQTALQIGSAKGQHAFASYVVAASMVALIVGASILLWGGLTFRKKLTQHLRTKTFAVTNMRAFIFDDTQAQVPYEWPLNSHAPRLEGDSSVYFADPTRNPKPHLPGFLMLTDAKATWLAAQGAWSNNVKAT
jgi:hypothetical protein